MRKADTHMAHDVISTCPVCSSELAVTRLHCGSCGTTLEGDFSVGRFGRLNRDQLALLESFLRSRGNLREMERELGISYPTVRSRVEALVTALGFGARADAEDLDETATEPIATATPMSRDAILEALARHELTRRGRRRRDPCARADRPMTRTSARIGIEHEIGPTGLLAIRLRAGDARLRAVDGSVVRVHDTDGDLGRSVQVERGDGSLSLRAGRGGLFDEGQERGSHSAELVIDVPTGATVVVEAASAEVTIEGLTGDQRYRTSSGDIRLRDVSGRLSAETVSGDIDVLAVDSSSIATRSVSGDLSVRAADLESVRATTTSGDVRLAGRLAGPGPFAIDTVSGDVLLALAGGLRLEASTVAGDVTSDVDARSEGRPGRRVLVVGEGGPTVAVRSMSGDVSLMHATAVLRASAPPHPVRPSTSKEPPMPPEPPVPPSIEPPVTAADSPTTFVDRHEPDADESARPLDPARPRARGDRRGRSRSPT